MINNRIIEIFVGIFVFIALLCLGYLTIQLGQLRLLGDDYYSLKSRFRSVSGLKEGNDVRIAGVQVGRVDSIVLNKDYFVSVVTLKIRDDIKLSDDSLASIKTSGLIGDKYVSISPGGSGIMLEPGDMIVETQSPIDFEELVSKYVFGGVKD
jgi:phospholipid/cholesterol/gamma-HCH transport system substrate-binding protein